LHIVGDIDDQNPSAFSKEELQTELNKTNKIIYHGRVDGVQQMIANSDCVVLPSYREGLPRVMSEALAMAKPVITTDVAGCRETVINGKNGFLVEVENVQDLSKRMREMTEIEESARQQMGENGRILAAEKFSTKKINHDFLTDINQIIAL